MTLLLLFAYERGDEEIKRRSADSDMMRLGALTI